MKHKCSHCHILLLPYARIITDKGDHINIRKSAESLKYTTCKNCYGWICPSCHGGYYSEIEKSYNGLCTYREREKLLRNKF